MTEDDQAKSAREGCSQETDRDDEGFVQRVKETIAGERVESRIGGRDRGIGDMGEDTGSMGSDLGADLGGTAGTGGLGGDVDRDEGFDRRDATGIDSGERDDE